jgi:hypothetical protein
VEYGERSFETGYSGEEFKELEMELYHTLIIWSQVGGGVSYDKYIAVKIKGGRRIGVNVWKCVNLIESRFLKKVGGGGE